MSNHETVQIAIDPALGIDAAAFARAWNADETTREMGSAEVGRLGSAEAYIDPAVGDVLVTMGVGFLTTVSAKLMVDAIKGLFNQAFKRDKKTEVIEIVTDSGEKIYIVRER